MASYCAEAVSSKSLTINPLSGALGRGGDRFTQHRQKPARGEGVRVGPWPNSDSFPLQLAILPWYSDGLVLKRKFLSVGRGSNHPRRDPAAVRPGVEERKQVRMANLLCHRCPSLGRQRALDLGLIRACPCLAAHHASVRADDSRGASVWTTEFCG